MFVDLIHRIDRFRMAGWYGFGLFWLSDSAVNLGRNVSDLCPHILVVHIDESLTVTAGIRYQLPCLTDHCPDSYFL